MLYLMIADYTRFASSFTKVGYETVTIFDASFPFAYHKDRLGVDMLPYPSHFHKEFEMHYVAEGEANILCNQTTFHAKKGDIVIIPPFVLHRVENDTPCCETNCFLFDKAMLGDLSFISDSFPPCTITNDVTNISSLQMIMEEMSAKASHYEFVVKGELLTLLSRLSRLPNQDNSVNNNEIQALSKVKKAIAYIEEHFAEKICIRDLSNLVNLSPSYFSYCFSQSTGKTAIAYIIDLRYQYAYHLISNDNATVSEACRLSGFDNYSYSSRKYREIFGFLPSKTPRSNS